MKSIRQIFNTTRKAGSVNHKHGTMYTTTAKWRNDYNLWVGLDGSVWVYFRLPLAPLQLEDAQRRYEVAAPLERVLTELGETSQAALITGLNATAKNRQIHILATVWDDEPEAPQRSTVEQLQFFKDAQQGILVSRKAVYVGAELWAETDLASVMGTLKSNAQKMLGDDSIDLAPYMADKRRVESIFFRHDALRTTLKDLPVIESWYSGGKGTDQVIVADHRAARLLVDKYNALEFAALHRFDRVRLNDPDDMWLAAAFEHRERCVMVSVRAEMQRPEDVRNRARSVQRRARATIEEQYKTGDLERAEDYEIHEMAKQLEDFFASGGSSLLTKCSIVFARLSNSADQTYMSRLRNGYGIDVKPLPHRQMEALLETLPCSGYRATEFEHDLTIPMISHSGILDWSHLGDETGILLGKNLPHLTDNLLDTSAASQQDKSPVMIIVSDPGGGKTIALQNIATQDVLNGRHVLMINPKPADDLSGMVHNIRRRGGEGEVIFLSTLSAQGGAFDAWRFAKTAEMAAEITAEHILNVLQFDGSENKQVELRRGLMRGADAGARCAMQALYKGVDDKEIIKTVTNMADASALFRLGLGFEEQEPLFLNGGLTLIQFDHGLSLPDPAARRADYSPSEKVAVATMQLITRAAVEMLTSPRTMPDGTLREKEGGTLIVDEAHAVMSGSEGITAIQRMARYARSQALFPILATQRLGDIATAELFGYVTRWLVLNMKDPKEAEAALRGLGIEPTKDRIEWLAQAGVVKPSGENPGRPPLGLFRDLSGRHGPMVLGPVPALDLKYWSTTPEQQARMAA